MFATILARFQSDLRQYNAQLDTRCRKRWGVSVRVWKTTKYLVELGSLVLAGFAIRHGSDPTTALMLAAFIISGPELFEFLAMRDQMGDE